jgi:hypothetical protein
MSSRNCAQLINIFYRSTCTGAKQNVHMNVQEAYIQAASLRDTHSHTFTRTHTQTHTELIRGARFDLTIPYRVIEFS